MGVPNWANRTVFTGDNLPVLRGMNTACVDLIYLDPPFNSNKTYSAPIGSKAAGAAFKDTWTLDDVKVEWIGLIADEHPALSAVICPDCASGVFLMATMSPSPMPARSMLLPRTVSR